MNDQVNRPDQAQVVAQVDVLRVLDREHEEIIGKVGECPRLEQFREVRAAVAELIDRVLGVTDAADYMLRNPHDNYAQRHYCERRDALLAALANCRSAKP